MPEDIASTSAIIGRCIQSSFNCALMSGADIEIGDVVCVPRRETWRPRSSANTLALQNAHSSGYKALPICDPRLPPCLRANFSDGRFLVGLQATNQSIEDWLSMLHVARIQVLVEFVQASKY